MKLIGLPLFDMQLDSREPRTFKRNYQGKSEAD